MVIKFVKDSNILRRWINKKDLGNVNHLEIHMKLQGAFSVPWRPKVQMFKGQLLEPQDALGPFTLPKN